RNTYLVSPPFTAPRRATGLVRSESAIFQQQFSPPLFTPEKNEEPTMKRCDVCGEDFPDQFSFCAIDGKPLAAHKHLDTREYHPTLLTEKSLAERLATEAQ